jgi:hypothetical protein
MAKRVLLCLTPVLLLSAQGQLPTDLNQPRAGPKHTVTGTVSNGLTGEPIRRALVQLFGQTQMSALTGPDGRFSFEDVPEGTTGFSTQKPGFYKAWLPAGTVCGPLSMDCRVRIKQSDGSSTAIVAGPNLDTEHLVFQVEPPASISGKVVDEENDPQPNLQVYLFRQSVVGGKYETRERSAAPTHPRCSMIRAIYIYARISAGRRR